MLFLKKNLCLSVEKDAMKKLFKSKRAVITPSKIN